MIPDFFLPIANHLWQSTLFGVVLGALSLLLRKNRAAVRFGLWFVVSVKFLVPFSVFVSLFSGFVHSTELSVMMEQVPDATAAVSIAEGFRAPLTLSAEPVTVATSALPLLLGGVWLGGTLFFLALWFIEWLRLRRARRNAVTADLGLSIPALITAEAVEPGIVGIFRPVLMLPEGLQERLTADQLRTIIDHELCHASRRDNLAAAIHMGVEAIFWFHPLLWWVGSRLVEEREKACDEAVLQCGSDPAAYARGILSVCRFYKENALACTSGVTGANLNERIDAIMKNEQPRVMGFIKRSILVFTVVLAVVLPVTVGTLAAGLGQVSLPVSTDGPAFEAASIRLAAPDDRVRTADTSLPSGRYVAKGQTLRSLIEVAYSPNGTLPQVIGLARERIIGGPDWIHTERFSVEASAGRAASGQEVARMLRLLLADRFKLRVHVEARPQAVYELVRVTSDKVKPRLVESKDCEKSPRQGIGGAPGRMNLQCAPIALLAEILFEVVGRPVFDNTGMMGKYSGLLEYTATDEEIAVVFGGVRPPGEEIAAGPSVFTALQEQFGLRLVSTRRPVEVLVIDSVERPSPN